MIWPQARPFVEKVLARDAVGRYLPEDVLAGLLNATLRLWISWDDDRSEVEAVCVTETIQYPRARELRLWLVGGRSMRRWVKPMADLLEQYARETGCAVLTGGDRKGWLRIGGEGWSQTGITFEKRL